MNLADRVVDAGIKSLAIVGTAKNVGKTVTMNHLAAELAARGLTVGLASSGRDGETTDSFTGEPKPSVVPPVGSWVATAERAIHETDTALEIRDVLENPGLLGRLVLGRMADRVPVELVGPASAGELSAVVLRLQSLGAEIVLVDGALDRLASASPTVTDAVILATGATAQDSMKDIADQVGRIVKLWSRPVVPDPVVRQMASRAMASGKVTFIFKRPGAAGSHGYFALETRYRTVLGSEEAILSSAEGAAYVVVPGAVTGAFLSLSSSFSGEDGPAIVAKDPVLVFGQTDKNTRLYVRDQIRLLAITVNPSSYKGAFHDPGRLVLSVGAAAKKASGRLIPVFDVVSGETNTKEVGSMALG